MEEIIKIPDERLGALIGPEGTVRNKIAIQTRTKIRIDSASGEVEVEGEGEGYVKAVNLVHAIARGFSPERAYTLLKDDYTLKIIEVVEFIGKNESNLKAKRGRVIGREGLARKNIEKKTKSLISVYGKTIAIIAKLEDREVAIEAVELLLKGAKHETMEQRIDERAHDRFKL